MASFTLLKYWRRGGARANARSPLTTIVTVPQENYGKTDRHDDEPSQSEPGSTGADSESVEESNVPVSPADDLFFKGEPVPVQAGNEPEPDLKSQFSRLKSATNFRVLLLKLKKNKQEKNGAKNEKVKNRESKNKLFAAKLKIGEMPIRSVSKRDESARSRTRAKKPELTNNARTEDKKLPMQRYLKMARLSKRAEEVKKGRRKGDVATGPVAARRRDDSLLQQQDGIQGAILHCKRSFNASRDSDSVSDPPCDHKSTNTSMKNCSDEPKENGL